MAVQFLCPGCDQPLEVDDQWASKPVACPYCRKTVTVPAQSTFNPQTVGPQASPLDQPMAAPLASPTSPPPTARPNALAQWATVLAVAALGLHLVFIFTTVPKIIELTGSEQPTPEEIRRALLEQIESGAPNWLVMASFTILASLAAWVAGLVCGIIAVAQPARPRLAVISLAISGLTLCTCCMGGL